MPKKSWPILYSTLLQYKLGQVKNKYVKLLGQTVFTRYSPRTLSFPSGEYRLVHLRGGGSVWISPPPKPTRLFFLVVHNSWNKKNMEWRLINLPFIMPSQIFQLNIHGLRPCLQKNESPYPFFRAFSIWFTVCLESHLLILRLRGPQGGFYPPPLYTHLTVCKP